MEREWDDREQGSLQAAYRAHLREMSAARQAAERHRASLRPSDPEDRLAADRALRAELTRLTAEHNAWLFNHGLTGDASSAYHTSRLTSKTAPK